MGILLALLLCAASPSSGDEDVLLSFEQSKGEHIVFRFWVPLEAVKDLYPEPLSPAMPRRGLLFGAPPAGYVECRLVLRFGSYSYEMNGNRVTSRGVIDGLLLLAVQAPYTLNPGGDETAFLLEYYCSDDSLADLLRGAGLPVSPIKGSFDSSTRADSQQQVEGSASAGAWGEWRWRLATTDLRHYDTARSKLRVFFHAGSELRALEISFTDDFYMRAVGRINLDAPTPLDRWDGWRSAADDRALYQYNTRNPHRVLRVGAKPAPKP